MRLPELLSLLDHSTLEQLAIDKLPDRDMPAALLAGTLEGVLRSYSYVQRAIVRRQPPAFGTLLLLTEAEGRRLRRTDMRSQCMEATELLCEQISVPGILGRESELHLYRRVLAEARRSELDLDPSETALLGVLRRELKISHVEHYLMEHHPDLQMFWRDGEPFDRELDALLAAGIVFLVGDEVVLPEDTVAIVRQSIGIRLARAASQRLYTLLSGAELSAALAEVGSKSTGSKEEKIDRLVANFVQAGEVLQQVNLAELRDVARGVGCNSGGSREEVADRLIGYFDRNADLLAGAAPPDVVPPEREARALDRGQFHALLAELSGHQLAEVLSGNPELRQSGTKDVRITTLWDSHLCERSILNRLTSRDLEDALNHLDLRISGSKAERVERLIEHFRGRPIPSTDANQQAGSDETSST